MRGIFAAIVAKSKTLAMFLPTKMLLTLHLVILLATLIAPKLHSVRVSSMDSLFFMLLASEVNITATPQIRTQP